MTLSTDEKETALTPQGKTPSPHTDTPQGGLHKYYTLCIAVLQGVCRQIRKESCRLMRFLKKLYEQGIYPSEEIVPADPAYKTVFEKLESEFLALQASLPPASCERLEALKALSLEESSLYAYANFAYGLRLGLLLALDALTPPPSARKGV